MGKTWKDSPDKTKWSKNKKARDIEKESNLKKKYKQLKQDTDE